MLRANTSQPRRARGLRSLDERHAETVATDGARRDVDLVIALDVSSSMDGLIESAKQRLWDITNELAQARPVPALRVAILSYGRPSYGEQSGYVRVDLPFTADLDAVNATLFAFQTDGGDEYVARAIQTSLDKLQWSQHPDALQVVFVAGNESAEQDPQLTLDGRPERRRTGASSSTRSSAAATMTPTHAAGSGLRRARTASTRASIKARPRSRTSRRRSTRASRHSTTSSTPPTSRSATPARAVGRIKSRRTATPRR